MVAAGNSHEPFFAHGRLRSGDRIRVRGPDRTSLRISDLLACHHCDFSEHAGQWTGFRVPSRIDVKYRGRRRISAVTYAYTDPWRVEESQAEPPSPDSERARGRSGIRGRVRPRKRCLRGSRGFPVAQRLSGLHGLVPGRARGRAGDRARPRAHDRGRGGHRDEDLGQPGGSAEDEPDDRAHSDPCDGPDSRYRVRRRRHGDQWIRHRGRAWNHDGSHGRPRILHLDRMGPVDRPGPSVAAPDRAAPVGGERLSRRRLPTGVLRQAGAVHQFRHARLRDRMAEVHGRREREREQPTEATGVS